MKREDVLKVFPEATKEQVSDILGMNSREIGEKLGEISTLTAELQQSKNTTTVAQNELLRLQTVSTERDDLKTKYDALVADVARQKEEAERVGKEQAVLQSIEAVFPQDKEFVNEYVRNGIISDMKAQKTDENTFEQIFELLTKNKDGIFKNKRVGDPIDPPNPLGSSLVSKEKFDAMSLREKMEFASKNPQEFSRLKDLL